MTLGINDFRNHLPVQIDFGVGSLARVAQAVTSTGAHHPVVISEPVVLDLAVVRELLADLQRVRAPARVVSVEPGEPTLGSVDQLGARLQEGRLDVIVAIGGGSVLDSAKGARMLLENEGPISRYVWPGAPEPIRPPAVPLVTVPTTSGSGSEVTGGIVMTDPAALMKVAAPSPSNRAQYCFVDPRLTLSLPAQQTLWGGLDALGQAIGSVIAKVHTPVGDGLGLEAIRMAVAALPVVLRDPEDLAARSAMSCAALLAGLAMNVSEAGTEHSLAHPLGSRFRIPHGLSVGLMLAESIGHDRHYVPERFERVADAMGEPADGTRDGSRAVRAVRRLLAATRCPTLRECGVSEGDIESLVDCAQSGWVPVEPGPWGRDDISRAYLDALACQR